MWLLKKKSTEFINLIILQCLIFVDNLQQTKIYKVIAKYV